MQHVKTVGAPDQQRIRERKRRFAGAVIQQQLQQRGVTSSDRQGQRPSAIRQPRGSICSLLQKELYYGIRTTPTHRNQQSGAALARAGIRVGAAVEQQSGFLGVFERIHQRGSASIILRIRVRACCQQKPDGFCISIKRRVHEGCPAAWSFAVHGLGIFPHRAVELLTIAITKGMHHPDDRRVRPRQ